MRRPPKGRLLLAGATLGLAGVLFGCNGPTEPKMVEAPPPPPPTAEDQEAKGKPEGYGTNKAYEDAMEKQFGGKR
ncbi:MAG: hypothetical protein AB7I30_08715 [Isosphaeraceae bacterium]